MGFGSGSPRAVTGRRKGIQGRLLAAFQYCTHVQLSMAVDIRPKVLQGIEPPLRKRARSHGQPLHG